MNTPNSTGICLYCNRSFSKSIISRHVQKHLKDKVLLAKPGSSFLVKAEANPKWGARHYFLLLWIDGEAAIGDLDDFLRGIWLECCGHMSSFTNPKIRRQHDTLLRGNNAYELLEQGKLQEYKNLMEGISGEVSMDKLAKKALYKDLKLNYQYDFGSTTALLITVVDEYDMQADDGIVLISRNEPLNLNCDLCGKEPALHVCIECASYKSEWLFCKKCAKKHAKTCEDFAEYAALPVVNSPRMGVCGYDGGTIDKDRDGN